MVTRAIAYRPELDGIRAVAVLAVVAFHSYVVVVLLGGGWLGVDVFFVLSGYLITAILLAEHRRTGTIALGSFWVRRLLRLYPALLVALGLGAFFYTLLGDGGTALGYARTAGAAGGYVENFVWGLGHGELGRFGHTWSLAVEMQFYLAWPPVLLWMLRRPGATLASIRRWVVVAILLSYVLLVLESGLPGGTRFPVGYSMPWSRACELLLGALVAFASVDRPAPAENPRRWTGWLLVAGLGVTFLTAATYSILVTDHVLAWQAPLISGLTAALLLHLDKVGATGVGAVLAWAPLAWIGRISYGIYLFHYPVLWVLRDHGIGRQHASAAFLAGTAVSVALAAASYYLIERPVLRRFSQASTTRAAMPASAALPQARGS